MAFWGKEISVRERLGDVLTFLGGNVHVSEEEGEKFKMLCTILKFRVDD